MGKALDWIGADGCGQVAEEILDVRQTRNGEIWAACPFHQESTPGNAFSYNPARDQGYCNSCGAKADIIKIYGAIHGMDDSAAFIAFRDTYAPGQRLQKRNALRTPTLKRPDDHRKTLDSAARLTLPDEKWQAKASALVEWAHTELMKNADKIAWLEARGITRQTAARFRLGWIGKDIFRPREAWGLPTEIKSNGKPKKLWIPVGLTIPFMDGETVLRVRLRKEEGEPRFYVIPGSCTNPAPMFFSRSTWKGEHRAVVVTEAELDAMLVSQEVGDIVSVVASGSATATPTDKAAADFVHAAAWVGMWADRDAAGDKGVASWLQLGRSVTDIRPEPLAPGEKSDPGDWHKAGRSVRDHVLSRIPRAWRPRKTVRALASGGVLQGAGGEEVKADTKEVHGEIKIAESVRKFGRFLEGNPVVCKWSDDTIAIRAMKVERGKWVEDSTWNHLHWELSQEIWGLFWHDDAVGAYLCVHPDREVGINGKNFWRGVTQ